MDEMGGTKQRLERSEAIERLERLERVFIESRAYSSASQETPKPSRELRNPLKIILYPFAFIL